MNETGFRSWLQNQGYNIGTTNSRVSNCLRVCEYEGNIDSLYRDDKCKTLLNRLTYSTSDERYGRPPRHSIPINGNVRNGTATLKQAVRLYIQFLENNIDLQPVVQTPIFQEAKASDVKVHSTVSATVIDSYEQFLDYFGIDKDIFYSFGLDNTIFAKPKQALSQWETLKDRLLGNQQLAIRGYGRQGKHTDLFFNLYEYLFSNNNIREDSTNNAVPRRNIQIATGHRINDSLLNFQCSHIFGHTKNPLLFEAVWNICFTPKMFDPLTGHEAKGPWPEEYQKLFIDAAMHRFSKCVEDYNAFVRQHNILNRISEFVETLNGQYDDGLLQKFRDNALSEWQPICEEVESK